MRFSFSILINTNLCSLSTQKQSHCFSITIVACIFHGGNTFHKPCQALDFSIWYVLFWLVRCTLHKQYSATEFRLPDGFKSVSSLEVLWYLSICYLFSLKFSSQEEMITQKSNIAFVSCFIFWLFFNIMFKTSAYESIYFIFLEAIQCSEQIRWKHHRRKKRINNKINNFLKPFLRIKMPSLVSDRNLIRLNLTFDIKNIERKLTIRSVCIPNPFFVFFFFRHNSNLDWRFFRNNFPVYWIKRWRLVWFS